MASLAFVVSGFLQVAIEDSLTRVPDYYGDTAVLVYNGNCDSLTIKHDDIWQNPNITETTYKTGERTPTHDDILTISNIHRNGYTNLSKNFI